MPGFPRILIAIAEAYRAQRDEIENNAESMLGELKRLDRIAPQEGELSFEIADQAANLLLRTLDPVHGGFGNKPKFPPSMTLSFLLRQHHRTKDQSALNAVELTLEKMARSGMYDQLGGGFHRYSVDEKWLVPHFEKMLYDNAQLTRIYAQTYTITGEPLFKAVVEETVAYLVREMLDAEGGFYSTQDADSEGEEGKFFVWTPAEIAQLLGEERGEIFSRIYDVSEEGNFEKKNILHPILTVEQASKFFRKDQTEIEALIADARQQLFTEREKRIKPFRDEKIITAWNGLMLSSLGEAIKILDQPGYVETAKRIVDFLFGKMFRDGFLLHTYKDGQAKLLGYLDDYTFVIVGLLDLYEATFDRSLLDRATQLSETVLREFSDERDGGFFYTGKSHEQLISRAKPVFDASIPSGNAMATQALLRLYHMTGNDGYRGRAEQVLRSYYDAMTSQPFGFAHLLCALDLYLHPAKEIVVVGEPAEAQTRALARQIHALYLPNKTLQLISPQTPLETVSPLLQGKTQVDGNPTVYVCQNFTCSAPVTSWEDLKILLES
jgi:hypothetical protein